MPTPVPDDNTSSQVTNAFSDFISQPDFWTRLLYLLLLFVVCLVAMKILFTLTDRAIKRLPVEKSLHTFIKSVTRILLWFLTILILADYIGIPVSSLLAVLGVVGLAVSLAVQGTLSNLAGGIMVLVSKPFVVGDYVEVNGVGGLAADIGLVYTQIKTFDNKIIFVPNGEISAEKIVNYTTQSQRRVDLKFDVAYEDDPEKVKRLMREVVGAHPKALFSPTPFIRTASLNESSVSYQLRVWCATEDYWDLYYDLLEQIRAAFDQNGISLTYNHLNVHLIHEETQSKGQNS